jgi:Holliday junction resolvase RusA-like endonuclease
MNQTLFIPHQFPSLNDYINTERRNRYAGAAMKKEWTKLVASYALLKKIKPFKKPISIHFTYFEPNARRDPDNIMFAKKFILDGLKEAGVIQNDNQQWLWEFRENWLALPSKNSKIKILPEKEVGVEIQMEEVI